MLSQLPGQADPRRLCEQGKRFEGRVALQDLTRLAPLLTSTEGEAAFTLAFDRDGEGRRRVRGRVRAELRIQCQRCLEAMSLPVDVEFCLSPVSGLLEAESLPEGYEPLLLEERLLRLLDLVEDELILAIPPAPRHRAEECGVDMADYRQAPEPVEEERENPFSVLVRLKRDN